MFLRLLAVLGIVLGLAVVTDAQAKEPAEVMNFAQLVQAGWKAPRPPYPAAARMHKESGTVFLYVKTDADGKVAESRVADGPESVKSDVLRHAAASYARSNWQGPPNSQVVAEVAFSIH